MLNPTIPTQYVAILANLVRQNGHTGMELYAGTDLGPEDLARFDRRLHFSDFITLVGNAYRITGDKALGLHFGEHLNLSSHATLGHALMNCEDFNQALQLFLKYYHILAPNLDMNYREQDGRCYLIPDWHTLDFNPQFSHEFLFASILTSVRYLLNMEHPGFRLELPYPAPAHAALYYKMFGDDVHFNCAIGQLSTDLETLAVPLPSSNQVLRELYEKECQRLLADLAEEQTVGEQTLQILRKLEGQYPQAEAVAALLNFSARTFRRRLAKEDMQYQDLLDQVRTEHAIHHLTHTRLPISSIAYMLGFNDVSNFRRAFIKWTDMSPRDARNQTRQNL